MPEMSIAWVWWCVATVVLLCDAVTSERVCDATTRRKSPKGVCGSALANLVSIVCRGIFSNSYREKRQVADLSQPEADDSLFLTRRTALSYLHGRLQKRYSGIVESGIVCECCYNICSHAELTEYCGTSKYKRAGRATMPVALQDLTKNRNRVVDKPDFIPAGSSKRAVDQAFPLDRQILEN